MFLCLGFSSAAQAQQTILITAFDPFGGASVNNSYEVALELQNQLQNFHAEICLLPTIFDVASDEARKCFEALPSPPVAVISLGEADCRFRFETQGQNLDWSTDEPDNRGETRKDHVIDPTGPEFSPTTLPLQAMFQGLSRAQRSRIVISSSAGNFVCNNTAYHLSRYFSGLNMPYGFIHVPGHACSKRKKDPVRNAEVLARMIDLGISGSQTNVR